MRVVLSFLFVVGLMIIISSCNKSTNLDFYPYYESQYKEPYGTYVFYQELKSILPYTAIEPIKDYPYYENSFWDEMDESIYMYINIHFYLNDAMVEKLLNTQLRNNSIFISTTDFSNTFFKTYNISTRGDSIKKIEVSLKYLRNVKDSVLKFKMNSREDYILYFHTIPKNARILGTVKINGKEQPNFIELNLKDSNNHIFLHCNPEWYTNYYMLQNGNGGYAFNTLSYMNDKNKLYWDGYRTQQRYNQVEENTGGTGEILYYFLQNKSLKWIIILLFFGGILLLTFNYKRIQREIPYLLKPQNESIAFVKLISGLYINQSNFIDPALYRVNYILDIIHQKYNISPAELETNFQKRLSDKSGIPFDDLNSFISEIKKIRYSDYLNKKDFFTFNQILESNIHKLNLYERNK